ncbi:adaptin N terminal region-domain-containing protein [Corynascus novoguineensis]|uniref:AP-3 complex subunit delta n=1 Tax=Corynascus novoguineensis TaxID=1126955 RepID=A0AAN7CSY3_9PEZI|nr:adaptin N terminal region-domain-containing protein [Corynascus novoguineensis]
MSRSVLRCPELGERVEWTPCEQIKLLELVPSGAAQGTPTRHVRQPAPSSAKPCAVLIPLRFEKSLYDLIRGLRNHKGNEKEYIQSCLKECRAEIRSQDMDVKATALLKLVYLEMVGHDMSWASFHVLEVMSSQKYHQKRVGYLAAVQSFRPDTDDVAASTPTIIALPIAALPHIVTPSLAMSLLGDLLPRLNHSHAAIRKKTVVTLYRLALVYPEALRASWPKIKERLMDPEEDSSVTAAIVNVVCELGWRRPHDFLPLAPRLFELLVEGGNNWMAIKLIKLFATLTPLEPRLVRKLLPPLTDLIRTTPAMSLLYECINGIIQGGFLGSGEDFSAREEVASLCVTKLRGMVSTNSDPNLKYVALLAYNRIQEDVILECIDSEDITIRIKALDLVQGMVSSDNLLSIVSRLMRQLKASSAAVSQQQNGLENQDPESDSSDERSGSSGRRRKTAERAPPLPEDYTVDVIGRILKMCSQDNYANMVDFDWYLDVLAQLIRIAPAPRAKYSDTDTPGPKQAGDISEKIGNELRNVAVKVKAIRAAAVRTAELAISRMSTELSPTRPLLSGALKPVAWIVGEYAVQLLSPDDTLRHLLDLVPRIDFPESLATTLQAVMKLFAYVAGDDRALWTPERKSSITLLMARVIHVLEPFALHPYLEVQERAVEFIELLKLTAEAAAGQAPSTDEIQQDPPLLLTQAIPSLFTGWELNSVAAGTQQNVPIPGDLDLDEPIHPDLNRLLSQADSLMLPISGDDEFEAYYNQKPAAMSMSSEPAINRLPDAPEEAQTGSYQQAEESYLDPDIIARRKAERMERYRDDPFYIPDSTISGGRSTPIHNILQKENGFGLDIDSIPIMQLDLNHSDRASPAERQQQQQQQQQQQPAKSKPRQRIVVAADETLGSGSGGSGLSTPRVYDSDNTNAKSSSSAKTAAAARKLKQQSLLQITSSHLNDLSLEEGSPSGGDSGLAHEQQQREEAEMEQALKEVQRLRLEMQRAKERIQVAQGVPVEGVVVRKKKKGTGKKAKAEEGGGDGGDGGGEEGGVKAKKKKKTVKPGVEGKGGKTAAPVEEGGEVVKPKKKKKVRRVVHLDEGEGAAAGEG